MITKLDNTRILPMSLSSHVSFQQEFNIKTSLNDRWIFTLHSLQINNIPFSNVIKIFGTVCITRKCLTKSIGFQTTDLRPLCWHCREPEVNNEIIFFFYFKHYHNIQFSITRNCRPSTRPFKASKMLLWFLCLLSLMLILALVVIGYIIMDDTTWVLFCLFFRKI